MAQRCRPRSISSSSRSDLISARKGSQDRHSTCGISDAEFVMKSAILSGPWHVEFTANPNKKAGHRSLAFWLMRGAQPATSSGARLFAGSPIPAPSPPCVAAKKLKTPKFLEDHESQNAGSFKQSKYSETTHALQNMLCVLTTQTIQTDSASNRMALSLPFSACSWRYQGHAGCAKAIREIWTNV